jgi:hypothetical protein
LIGLARDGCAPVVELVDALDSKSCSERSAGSSPAWGTNNPKITVTLQIFSAPMAALCAYPWFDWLDGTASIGRNDKE